MTKHFDEFIKNSNVFFKVMEVGNMREAAKLTGRSVGYAYVRYDLARCALLCHLESMKIDDHVSAEIVQNLIDYIGDFVTVRDIRKHRHEILALIYQVSMSKDERIKHYMKTVNSPNTTYWKGIPINECMKPSGIFTLLPNKRIEAYDGNF